LFLFGAQLREDATEEDMRLSLLLLGVVAAVVILGASATPLDDYVHAPDPTYRWSLNATHTGWLGYKVPLLLHFTDPN